MKLIALVAALALSGTAMAQDQTAPASPSAPPGAPGSARPADPVGGLQPSTPAMSGTPQPGQQVVFQPSTQTPDQAFPPPPALEKYPPCTRTRKDHCKQRGGK